MGTRSFPGVKSGRGVLLTIHPLLVPRSWKSRAIPLPTLWATTGPVTGTLYTTLPSHQSAMPHITFSNTLFWFAVYVSLSLDPKNIDFIISGIRRKYESAIPRIPCSIGKGGLGFIYRTTQKKWELLKNPTEIGEIQEKKFIDRN